MASSKVTMIVWWVSKQCPYGAECPGVCWGFWPWDWELTGTLWHPAGHRDHRCPDCRHAGTSSARSLHNTCWHCLRVRKSFNRGQLFLLLFGLWQGQVPATQDNFEAAFAVQHSPTLSESCMYFIPPQCHTWKQILISRSPFQSGLAVTRLLLTSAISLPSLPSLSFLLKVCKMYEEAFGVDRGWTACALHQVLCGSFEWRLLKKNLKQIGSREKRKEEKK